MGINPNRCNIAKETAAFLTDETWCTGALVNVYNDAFVVEDEAEEFRWMRDHINDEGYACCLVGSLVRALVANGCTEWDEDTRRLYHSLGTELATTINVEVKATLPLHEGQWGFGIITEFNDNTAETFDDVKNVASLFAERVCNAETGE